MTDFDPNWPHGHVLKNGNEFTVFMKRPGYWIGEFFAPEKSWYPAKWSASNGRLMNSACYSAECYSLINAPAPKRTFKRWYVAIEWMGGDVTAYSYKSKESADKGASAKIDTGKVIARFSHEFTEGDGLDDSNLQKMHSAPKPEGPKTVHLDFWVNVEPNGAIYVHQTRALANDRPSESRVACIHIERDVPVGAGLHD